MKAVTKIVFLDDQNEKFFGEGPYRLLHAVERTGSLHAAAQSMDMAYTKALKLLKNAEKALGFPLTTRVIGGKNGGGSCLTSEGMAFLRKYEACRDACAEANRRIFREYFPQIGCVIMASGLGKRFGGNKLMADFAGEPLICRILQATEGSFARRVVLTRHDDVAAMCRKRGIEVILHDLPLRSDAIRLGIESMQDTDACMFCPGDQPLLRRDTVAALVHSRNQESDAIWRLQCGDKPGSPVLFPAWAYDELMNLPEGSGGSHVLRRHSEQVRCLEIEDAYELMDADTPDELAMLVRRFRETEVL